jgi:hypothetical protein
MALCIELCVEDGSVDVSSSVCRSDFGTGKEREADARGGSSSGGSIDVWAGDIGCRIGWIGLREFDGFV